MNIDKNYLKFAVFDPTKCRLNLKVGLTRGLFTYPDREGRQSAGLTWE
jgi:hypothetical protein